jgi:hypothetical protein
MHKLQHKGLDKIITFLDAINCQYKIIDELGNVHSNFTEIEKKSKRKPSFYPHGEMMKYVKQQLEPMKVGEVLTIPVDKFDVPRIASSASTYLSQKFGKKSCTVHQTDNGVECLRFF